MAQHDSLVQGSATMGAWHEEGTTFSVDLDGPSGTGCYHLSGELCSE